MKPEGLASLVADIKPTDLTADESVAYDLAFKLGRVGTLPEPLYWLAVATLGQDGKNEMIYLVGLHAMVSDHAQRVQRAGVGSLTGEPVRAHFAQFHCNRRLFAAFLYPGRERLERGALAQGIAAVGGVDGREMDEGLAVGELEGGVLETRGSGFSKLLEHFLNVLLVLFGAPGLGFVPDHNCPHDVLPRAPALARITAELYHGAERRA